MEMWDGSTHYNEDLFPDEDTAPPALVPTMRDPEEMRVLHLQRLRELEEAANQSHKLRPCETCRHKEGWRCSQPLVKGFEKRGPYNMDDSDLDIKGLVYQLCGPERALWAPKLTITIRIKEFFQLLWLRIKGEL